jgi:hypothetical protein
MYGAYPRSTKPASTADWVLLSTFYHFAFDAGGDGALEQKRQEIVAKGIKVTEGIDHEWAK